ncbi:MAG: uL22 family ribosomal protein [Pseudomonadota bacterium]
MIYSVDSKEDQLESNQVKAESSSNMNQSMDIKSNHNNSNSTNVSIDNKNKISKSNKLNKSNTKIRKEAYVVVSAYKKNINSTPQKTSFLCRGIRNKKVKYVRDQLTFSNRKPAKEVLSLLRSCEQRVPHADVDNLYVVLQVNKGYIVKRYRCRAKGASSSIYHRKAHLTLRLVQYKTKKEVSI